MSDDVLGFTAQIVSAHLTKNAVPVEELPALIREVYKTLSTVGEAPAPVEAVRMPTPLTAPFNVAAALLFNVRLFPTPVTPASARVVPFNAVGLPNVTAPV